MFKNLISFLVILMFIVKILAQQTGNFTSDLAKYNNALELYNNKQFLASQTIFSEIKNDLKDPILKEDCTYYIISSALQLNQQDADFLMKKFLENHPTNIKRNEAYFQLANFYFENEAYDQAFNYYNKIDTSTFSLGEKEKFNFNIGYTHFYRGEYADAKTYFEGLENSESYKLYTQYYLGFIAYENDDFEKANSIFESLENEEKFLEELSYFKVDMNFRLGKFQKAIDLGLQQIETSDPNEKSELSKIIGESYLKLEDYEKAIPYLKNYKGKNGNWNANDYFQLGYAYYKIGDFETAINEFKLVENGNDEILQNSYYHLAECYLRTNQKQEALEAFKNASEFDFSKKIEEDALLNYVKLSYEIETNPVITSQAILSFIEKYPNNDNTNVLRELLVDTYLSSKQYKAALELLESNAIIIHKDLYQEVAFYSAVEVYNQGEYYVAIELFKKSLKYPEDAIFTARATYWKAESYYNLLDFEKSVVGYKQFLELPKAPEIPEFKNSYYNLGYNYFKLKEYTQAINYFQKYTSSSTKDLVKKSDAYLRIADSYFVSSSYWKAIENYSLAIENDPSVRDYATYQKAISYGFVNKNEKKIEALESFFDKYPKSNYKDAALFELANTYLSQDKNRKAMMMYEKLITEVPSSKFIPKALLKQGLILDNEAKSNEAISKFKKVVSDFPSSQEALEAINSSKIIFIEQGRVAAYASWVNSLDFVEIDNKDIDDATYKAAEQPYLENNTVEAIDRFEGYLSDFPNGLHALNAHFYLAQLYFKEKNNDKAIPHYDVVANQIPNEYTEQSLVRLSELYLEKKDYSNALINLNRLEEEAKKPKSIIFAKSNLMKANYELQEYDQAINYAEEVLSNTKIDKVIKTDAKVILARAAFKIDDFNKAKKAYKEVAKIASGELAAEAQYYDAYFKHFEKQFEASNTSIQKLAKDFAGYKYYGAKGLILMAQNFYALKDNYQATYILESIATNFRDYPELIDEVKLLLEVIKKAETNTNSADDIEEN